MSGNDPYDPPLTAATHDASAAEQDPSPRGSPSSAIDLLFEQPVNVGQYRLLRRLGHGGMGVVFEAEHPGLDRRVALKLLRVERTTARHIERFADEARLLARLDHPNVARVFDSGTQPAPEGRQIPYYVMERITPGQNLLTYVDEQQSSLRERLGLFLQVLNGVAAANDQGVVHLDLKPGNLLVDAEGNVKVIDFGISRLFDEAGIAWTKTEHATAGTAAYMSPEQLAGDRQRIGVQSDVWALGVILYELLTGELPPGSRTEVYPATGTHLPAAGHAARQAVKLNPDLDRALALILTQALEPEPELRYPTVRELQEDVAAWLEGVPIAPRRSGSVRRAWVRTRKAAARRRRLLAPASALFFAALSVVVASAIYVGISDDGLRGYIESQMVHRLDYIPDGPPEHVVMVAVTDQTDVAALAEAEQLPWVTPDVPRSFRALYGRMLNRLAPAAPAAIAFDIAFPSDSIYDRLLAEGLDEARSRQIPVTVTLLSWEDGLDGPTPTASVVRPLVQEGSATLSIDPSSPRSADLAVQQPNEPVLPAFPLLAATSFRTDSKITGMSLRPEDLTVRLAFADGTPELAVRATDFVERAIPVPEVGLRVGASMAQAVLELPPSEAMQSAVVDLQWVFEATPAELADRFKGKLVMIADHREGRDYVADHPDGGTVPVSFMHMMAVEQLLTGRMPKRVSYLSAFGAYIELDVAFSMIAGAAGAGLGLVVGHRPFRRGLILVALLVGGTGSVAAAYQFGGWLVDPVTPAIALLLASELTAVVRLYLGR